MRRVSVAIRSTSDRLKDQTALIFAFLLLLLIGALLFASAVGAVAIPLNEQVRILARKLGCPFSVDHRLEVIYLTIRLPRVLLAALFGAGLGLSGAAIQGLFRNPLADPGIIGVSSGSALGAVLFIIFGERFGMGGWAPLFLPLVAAGGAIASTAAVYWAARDRAGNRAVANVMLAGVAVSSLLTAFTAFLTFSANDAQLRSIIFWTLGSLANSSWNTILLAGPFVVFPALSLLSQKRALNTLLLGETELTHLGFNLPLVQGLVIGLTALIVGTSVAFAGTIGFIGLVVPNLARLVLGADHRLMLPGSALLGASLLCLADLLSRILIASAEMPVGILTAIIGAPFFLWLIRVRSMD